MYMLISAMFSMVKRFLVHAYEFTSILFCFPKRPDLSRLVSIKAEVDFIPVIFPRKACSATGGTA